jgi:hypothetical protein
VGVKQASLQLLPPNFYSRKQPGFRAAWSNSPGLAAKKQAQLPNANEVKRDAPDAAGVLIFVSVRHPATASH